MAETSFDAVSGSLNSKIIVLLGHGKTGQTVTLSDNITNYKFLFACRVQDNGATYGDSYWPVYIFRGSFNSVMGNSGTRMVLSGYDNGNNFGGSVTYISDSSVKFDTPANWFDIYLFGIK